MNELSLEQEKICDIMRGLRDEGLGANDAVVSGSASMVAHGIDREKQIGDLDLFVTTSAWFWMRDTLGWSTYITSSYDDKRRHDPPYLYKLLRWDLEGKDVIEVNVFSAWRHRDHADIDVQELFEMAGPVHGFGLVADPAWLLDWKLEANREKDQPDIKLLRKFLAKE